MHEQLQAVRCRWIVNPDELAIFHCGQNGRMPKLLLHPLHDVDVLGVCEMETGERVAQRMAGEALIRESRPHEHARAEDARGLLPPNVRLQIGPAASSTGRSSRSAACASGSS